MQQKVTKLFLEPKQITMKEATTQKKTIKTDAESQVQLTSPYAYINQISKLAKQTKSGDRNLRG